MLLSCFKNLAEGRPRWVSRGVWEGLSRRERVFVVLWGRGVGDVRIQELLFFDSLAGVRMMRRRVLRKAGMVG